MKFNIFGHCLIVYDILSSKNLQFCVLATRGRQMSLFFEFMASAMPQKPWVRLLVKPQVFRMLSLLICGRFTVCLSLVSNKLKVQFCDSK